MLNEIRDMLKAVFRTQNDFTLAVSEAGATGMESCVAKQSCIHNC